MLALLELGRALRGSGYSFVTVTPETHRRVNERASAAGHPNARSVRDVFGWSRPFEPHVLPRELFALANAADVLRAEGMLFRSTVRFSSLQDGLFVHSAYPTTSASSVFFGPDTYRFADFVAQELARGPRPQRLVEIGCGSAAVSIIAARHAERVVGTDVNPVALRYAQVNAALAGIADRVQLVRSDMFRDVEGRVDAIIANPPFMADPAQRQYRDGGGKYGEAFALRLVREGLERLTDGGRLLLYTGAAVVDGTDTFLAQVAPLLAAADVEWRYIAVDPDIFGEEIERTDAYASVERIAAVELAVTRRSRPESVARDVAVTR